MAAGWNKGNHWPKEVRQKISKTIRSTYRNNPGTGKKRGEILNKWWTNPKNKQKQSEINKMKSRHMVELWASPDFREKMCKYWSDPEHRKEQAERTKECWADPDCRRRVIEGIRVSNRRKKRINR